MARPSKKNVYERISEKKFVIKETEELLVKLNQELLDLYKEQDELEMKLLLDTMKTNGLTLDKAIEILSKK